MSPLDFRAIFTIIAFASALAVHPAYAETTTQGRSLPAYTPALKTGDYVWHPEISPAGPVVLLVSLSKQILSCTKNRLDAQEFPRIGPTTSVGSHH